MKFIIKKILKMFDLEVRRLSHQKPGKDPRSLWAGLSKITIRRLFHFEKFLETKQLSGCIVECGVGSGDTLIFLKKLQKEKSDLRKIWAFDSFEGFPQGSVHDAKWFIKVGKPDYVKYTVDYVVNKLRLAELTDLEIDNIKFIKGWIPQSLNEFDGSQSISLLNVDLDLYQPTKDALKYFWPFMIKGGIIMLDEYDFGTDKINWPGAKKAVDEFCVENKVEVQIHYTGKAYLKK